MQLIWQKFQISFTLTTSTFEWWSKKGYFLFHDQLKHPFWTIKHWVGQYVAIMQELVMIATHLC